MSSDQLSVLARLNLQSEENSGDVWLPPSNHVAGLHPQVASDLDRKIDALRRPDATNPRGLVVQGPRGTGKTHFLRYARQQFCGSDVRGWFVLIELTSAEDFWADAAHGMVRSLLRDDQARRLLERLAIQASVQATTRTSISGKGTPTTDQLDEFVGKLRQLDFETGIQASDAARALALLVSTDQQSQNAGWNYLNRLDGSEHVVKTAGISNPTPSWRDIVRELSMLLAWTGPTLFAVDQIDGVVALSQRTSHQDAQKRATARQIKAVRPMAEGLMALRETTRRSVTLLSCLPTSWDEIRTQAVGTAADRFETTRKLRELPSAEIARQLVEQHLGDHYRAEGFQPPYPTWPVRPEALEAATDRTARMLLQRISDHIRNCLVAQEVTELHDLDAVVRPEDYHPENHRPPGTPGQTRRDRALTDLDQRWQELVAGADPSPALAPDTEDAVLPGILAAGLRALIEEAPGLHATVDTGEGRRPTFHARLRVSIDDATEDEVHWSFRGLAHEHPRAVQARLKPILAESGFVTGGPARNFVIVRDADWPNGNVTRKLVGEFQDAGGATHGVAPGDLQRLLALRTLISERPAHLSRWLAERRPAHETAFFKRVFGSDGPSADGFHPAQPPTNGSGGAAAIPGEAPGPSPPAPVSTDTADGPVVVIGCHRHDGTPFAVSLEQLRKHVLVVAGSGAGKTVLLKRLVEEIALQGVSSVVLDPNNDLSRLGDPWPVPPPDWLPGDVRKAQTYLAGTEVVIWTPRRSAGLALTFEPLPDLAAFRSDPDEFEAMVHSAVGVLAPRANLRGTTEKAQISRAVLTEALRFHGRQAGRGMEALIDLLEDLPPEATTFDDGADLARSMAKMLRATMVTDPLFAGTGDHTDPAELFTPSPGKRARVSVISFIGLPQPCQRQSFVSQLQLAVFSWARRNPSHRPLGGMLIMDEAQDFAPSTGTTPSTASTVQLAAQARKFGLGLAFATQAPRGLHNVVSGNTATQFIGRLTHPTQIDAADQLARARGAEIPDIARLAPGQFFAGTEGGGMRPIVVPLPLSHHSASAPTEEDVLQKSAARHPRAAGDGDARVGS